MRKLIFAVALTVMATPALAKDVSSVWVKQLEIDGYEEISVRRTWLGRVRIIAERGELEREIILNPRTGEVLRDYSRHEDGSLQLPLGFDVDFDDDDDDDDDQEDEEDEADD